jgi:hypothetical protein
VEDRIVIQYEGGEGAKNNCLISGLFKYWIEGRYIILQKTMTNIAIPRLAEDSAETTNMIYAMINTFLIHGAIIIRPQTIKPSSMAQERAKSLPKRALS